MGNWKLEVFRMGLYITFPVAVFYIFNQPQYFEEWVNKQRQAMYPPGNEECRKQFKEALAAKKRQQMEKELIDKLKSLEK